MSREAGKAELEALEAVYRDADALLAGWSCSASTECCRFGITGREPYVTSIELALLRRAIAGRGGLRAPATSRGRGRSLPTVDERRCPLLDDAGRCRVYAARPLGCRTFFCDRATPGEKLRQRDVNELVRRVREIAAAHEPQGDLGRPLTRALEKSSKSP